LLFVVFPSELAQPFLKSSEDIVDVVHIASLLFMIAAFSQILDAIRNVLGGALRAYDNTRNPMLAGIMAFWFIGLPLGYVLAFPLQFGVVGIPIGMATGIMIATVAVQRMYASELKQIVHRS
jgi:MATE family multidrug resistance protein